MKCNFLVFVKMNVTLFKFFYEKRQKNIWFRCLYVLYVQHAIFTYSQYIQVKLNLSNLWWSRTDSCTRQCSEEVREDVWSLARGGETTEPRGEASDHPLLTGGFIGRGSGGALGALVQRRREKDPKEYGSGLEETIIWRLGWNGP